MFNVRQGRIMDFVACWQTIGTASVEFHKYKVRLIDCVNEGWRFGTAATVKLATHQAGVDVLVGQTCFTDVWHVKI